MNTPWGIDLTTYHTMSGHSTWTYSTSFIYSHMRLDIWSKNRKRKNQLSQFHGLFFLIICSKGSFMCTTPPHPGQDNTYHILCYTSCGALAGSRSNSMSPAWGIKPTTYHSLSKCYTSELCLAPHVTHAAYAVILRCCYIWYLTGLINSSPGVIPQ